MDELGKATEESDLVAKDQGEDEDEEEMEYGSSSDEDPNKVGEEGNSMVVLEFEGTFYLEPSHNLGKRLGSIID